MKTGEDFWTRLFRWTANRLPTEIPERHRAELIRTFEAQRAEIRRRSGRIGACLYVLRAEWDLVRIGLRVDDSRTPTLSGGLMWTGLSRDLRFALRSFVRHPGTTVTIVLTLALGIGANTGAFSVLYNVLYQPLPYANPDEIVFVAHEVENVTIPRLGMSGPDLIDYQQGTPSLSALTSVGSVSTTITTGSGAVRIEVGMVTPEFFDVVGVEAVLGRTLTAEDWAPVDFQLITSPDFTPPPAPLVLSHRFWRERLGADPAIIGSTLEMNGNIHTVLGVMPERFRVYFPDGWYLPDDLDAWSLVPADPATTGRGGTNLTFLGRIAPGATLEQVQIELGRVSASLRARFPDHAERNSEARATRLHEEVVGPTRPIVWTLFVAVGLVLLIACVNVANLLLVRGIARQSEFRTRVILGAGPIRIGRQLLLESLLLVGAGSIAGLLLCAAGLRVLATIEPGTLPRFAEVDMDGTVLAFTTSVGLGTALLFGLAPFFGALRGGTRTDRGRGHTAGVRSQRTRAWLTSVELALSVLLVAGAMLLFRSVAELRNVEIGFEPDGVVTAQLSLPFFEFRDPADRVLLFDGLLREMEGVDWIEASALGNGGQIPLDDELRGSIGRYELEEARTFDATGSRLASHIFVTEGYFGAVGARLLEGRVYAPGELRTEQPARIVIDRRFSEILAPEGSALGQRVFVPSFGGPDQPAWIDAEVIGVIETIRYGSLVSPDERPTVFRSALALSPLEAALLVRTDRSPAEVEEWVRAELAAFAPNVPVHDIVAFPEIVDDAMALQRFSMTVLGEFALIALLLGGIGLYGVLSTAVGQRTREIGLRMALGAQQIDVLRSVARDGGKILGVGLVMGIVAAVWLNGTLRGLLYGVEPTDPITLITAPAILMAVGVVSCFVPARRAIRMNPSKALKVE